MLFLIVIVLVRLLLMLFLIVIVLVRLLLVLFLIVIVLVAMLVFRVRVGAEVGEGLEFEAGGFERLGEDEQVVGVVDDDVFVGGFQGGAVDDHQVGCGDIADVAGAELERVDVGTSRDQGNDLNAVAADLPHPVGDDLGGDGDEQGLGLRLLLLLLARGRLDAGLLLLLLLLLRRSLLLLLLLRRRLLLDLLLLLVGIATGDSDQRRAQRGQGSAERRANEAGHGGRGSRRAGCSAWARLVACRLTWLRAMPSARPDRGRRRGRASRPWSVDRRG